VDEKKEDTTKKLQNLLKKRGVQPLIYKQETNKKISRRTQTLTLESYSYGDD
jgi:hypothetical protein